MGDRLVHRAAETPVIIDAGDQATVTQLHQAVAAQLGIAVDDGALTLDGWPLPDGLSLAAAGLVMGSAVGVGHQPDAGPATPGGVTEDLELAVVGGLGAGQAIPVPAGTTVTVGRGRRLRAGRPRSRGEQAAHPRHRAGGGAAVLTDLDSRNGTGARGYRIDRDATLAEHDVVQLGETVVALRSHRATPARLEIAGGPGVVRFTVRPASGGPRRVRRSACRPGRGRRTASGSRSSRWCCRCWPPVARRLEELAIDQERTSRRELPDPAAVVAIGTGPTNRLFERRPGDPDLLQLRVRLADRPADVVLTGPGAGDEQPPTVHAVPVTVDLAQAGVLGIAGPREVTLPITRALLSQAARISRHHPGRTYLRTGHSDLAMPQCARTGWPRHEPATSTRTPSRWRRARWPRGASPGSGGAGAGSTRPSRRTASSRDPPVRRRAGRGRRTAGPLAAAAAEPGERGAARRRPARLAGGARAGRPSHPPGPAAVRPGPGRDRQLEHRHRQRLLRWLAVQ